MQFQSPSPSLLGEEEVAEMAKYLKGEDNANMNGALYYFIAALDEKQTVRALELIEVSAFERCMNENG